MGTPHRVQTKNGGRAVERMAALSRALPMLRGKQAVAIRLMRRAEQRGELGGTLKARLKNGARVELPRQSRMSWATAFTGIYDQAAVTYAVQFIEPNSVVLDVGASIGLWTVQLGKVAAARNSIVWAFEPNPSNTPWIRRNVEANALDGAVVIRETGLGDKAGSMTLASAEYGVGNGVLALEEAEGTAKFPRMDATIERLDDVPLPGRVSFIKIDTEGYEVAFLRGSAEVIERDRPVIFGEFSTTWLKRRGEDLRAALSDLDYEVATLTRGRSRPWRTIDTVRATSIDLASVGTLPQDLLLRPRSH